MLRTRNFEGAYYLTGLALECALKSAIARRTQKYDFPPKPRVVAGFYEHDLNRLLAGAGLEAALNTAVLSNPTLKANWALAKDWTIEARYIAAGLNAGDLYRAVAGRNGVLQWLRQYW